MVTCSIGCNDTSRQIGTLKRRHCKCNKDFRNIDTSMYMNNSQRCSLDSSIFHTSFRRLATSLNKSGPGGTKPRKAATPRVEILSNKRRIRLWMQRMEHQHMEHSQQILMLLQDACNTWSELSPNTWQLVSEMSFHPRQIDEQDLQTHLKKGTLNFVPLTDVPVQSHYQVLSVFQRVS